MYIKFIRALFQGIFKHYNADQSGSINSYEMRNAVNDAGNKKITDKVETLPVHPLTKNIQTDILVVFF